MSEQSLALQSKAAIVGCNGALWLDGGDLWRLERRCKFERGAQTIKGQTMRLFLLRNFLLIDAALLFLLGGLLIIAPGQVERAFHFNDLPAGVSYIIGLWGCALVTMGFGYAVAATHPIRHIVWVQVGVLRGACECVLGAVWLARGVVTFQQVGFGIIVAGLISLIYIVLYPRKPRLVAAPENTTPSSHPIP